MTVNGVQTKVSSVYTGTSESLPIFAWRYVDGYTTVSAIYTFPDSCFAKIYSVKFSEQGNLLRDMIPCYRKTDNVAGMYDIVNDVFYTNQGTGVFAVGADINEWKEW